MGPNWLTLGGQIELLLPSDPSQSDRTAVTVGDVLQWIMWREVPTLSQFPLDSGPLFQLLANGGAWILAEHREIVWQKMIWRHITQMRDAIHKLCTKHDQLPQYCSLPSKLSKGWCFSTVHGKSLAEGQNQINECLIKTHTKLFGTSKLVHWMVKLPEIYLAHALWKWLHAWSLSYEQQRQWVDIQLNWVFPANAYNILCSNFIFLCYKAMCLKRGEWWPRKNVASPLCPLCSG